MDSYENEASKFAAQRTKLKNICEAHDLTYTFIKNSYPIKLIIRPIKVWANRCPCWKPPARTATSPRMLPPVHHEGWCAGLPHEQDLHH